MNDRKREAEREREREPGAGKEKCRGYSTSILSVGYFRYL